MVPGSILLITLFPLGTKGRAEQCILLSDGNRRQIHWSLSLYNLPKMLITSHLEAISYWPNEFGCCRYFRPHFILCFINFIENKQVQRSYSGRKKVAYVCQLFGVTTSFLESNPGSMSYYLCVLGKITQSILSQISLGS